MALGSQLLGSYDDGVAVEVSIGAAAAAGFLNKLYAMNPTTRESANFEMINALTALIPMIPTNNGRMAFNLSFNNKRAGNKSFFFKSSSLCLRAVNEFRCKKAIEIKHLEKQLQLHK